MKTGYKAIDIMTTRPITAKPSITVKECADLMTKHAVGSIIIVEGKDLKGIVSKKDIVSKIVSMNKDASKTKVNEIMTPAKKMVTISPGIDIYEAMILMKENDVKRLPVMDDGKLLGLITSKDILKIEPALFDLLVENIRLREEDRKLQSLYD